MRTTAWDVIQYLMDYLGSDVTRAVPRVARRGLQAALRELCNARHWVYYYQHGRIATNAPYATGTVAYTASSRSLTLTGGTWPSWAAQGQVRIGTVTHEVVTRVSGTVLTLDPVLSPAADLASGTAYTLYRDAYTLPSDFVAMDRSFADVSWGGMQFVHPSEWLRVVRYYTSSSNTPRFYTILGDETTPERLAIRFFPYPDQDSTVDFVYHRRPRGVTLDRYEAGTAAVAATSTLTGTGTAFTSAMVGSVVRLSANATTAPTDYAGDNPAAQERTILAVSSATVLTVTEPFDQTLAGVKFQVSDPIDLEPGAMLDAFYRCCEKHVALERTQKERLAIAAAYQQALTLAAEADARAFERRAAGAARRYWQRLAQMPRGPDVS